MKRAVKKRIGKRIREKREEAGYTREALSELIGMSSRYIANLEAGDSAPSTDTVMKLCWVLSCSADDILFGEERNRRGWDTVAELLYNIDAAYIDHVSKVIRGIVEIILQDKIN